MARETLDRSRRDRGQHRADRVAGPHYAFIRIFRPTAWFVLAAGEHADNNNRCQDK